MAYTLMREIAVIFLTSLGSWALVPVLAGTPRASILLVTGAYMAMAFAAAYALGVLAISRVPLRGIQVMAAIAYAASAGPLWLQLGRLGYAGSLLVTLVAPLVPILLWAVRSRRGFIPTLFRGLWLLGFGMLLIEYGLMPAFGTKALAQQVTLYTAAIYFTIRLTTEVWEQPEAG